MVAGQEAATRAVPRVPWVRGHLGAQGKAPEPRRPRSPPWEPGSSPKLPVGNPKEEPGSLLGL